MESTPATTPEPEQYRPLVAVGEDREAAIEAVVAGWCEPIDPELDDGDLYRTAGTLTGVWLHDANTGEPIDLGELISRVEERIGVAADSPAGSRPDLAIRLKGCRVDRCYGSSLKIHTRIVFLSTEFNDTYFNGAKFGDGAHFDGAKFGYRASFIRAEFGNDARFGATTFGDGARFDGAKFGDGASFFWTNFRNRTCFDDATFGDGAIFDLEYVKNVTFSGVDLRRATLAFGIEAPSNRVWKLARWFDWSRVRALGNLQILTRASYLSLLLVPVLAGIWPGVRIAVNRLNQAMDLAASDVRKAAGTLAGWVEKVPVPGEKVKAARDEALAKLDEVRSAAQKAHDRFGPETLRTPLLPRSWMLAYLAALAVVGGHLIYQVAAPELVREQSREGLARERREGFHEDRPDYKDQLNRAFDFLSQVSIVLPEERNVNFARRHGKIVWLPSELGFLMGKEAATDKADPSKLTPATPPDTELMRIVIDEGAKAEYDLSAHDEMIWARVAGGLYGVGAIFIVFILVDQTAAILGASTGLSTAFCWLILIGIAVLVGLGLWLRNVRKKARGRRTANS